MEHIHLVIIVNLNKTKLLQLVKFWIHLLYPKDMLGQITRRLFQYVDVVLPCRTVWNIPSLKIEWSRTWNTSSLYVEGSECQQKGKFLKELSDMQNHNWVRTKYVPDSIFVRWKTPIKHMPIIIMQISGKNQNWTFRKAVIGNLNRKTYNLWPMIW